MNISRSKWFLSFVLACACWSPMLPATASEPTNDLTVTIDRTAQFPGPEGEDVLVPAGTYAVTVGNKRLTLQGTDTAPITIAAMGWVHTADIPFPTMVFLSSEEGEFPQRHLLALYDPDGKTLQAVGTDPVVTSRGTGEPTVEYVIDPALITFGQPVHFTASDGTPVVVEPGTYTAEASEQTIRLISRGNSANPLLLEARRGTHEAKLDVLLALSLPGTTPKEFDLHYLMLLLPTGESLEAIGSYSGVQTRSLLTDGFSTIKTGVTKGANVVGSGVTQGANVVGQGAKIVGSGVTQGVNVAGQGAKIVGGGVIQGAKIVVSAETVAIIQAGKGLEWAANATWKGAKWAFDQMDKAAKIVFCYCLIGSMELAKAGGAAMQYLTKLVEKITPDVINDQAAVVGKLANKIPLKDQISHLTAQLTNQLPARAELDRIRGWTNNPANIANVRAQFAPENLCRDSKFDLRSSGLAKNVVVQRPQGQSQITVAMVPGTYRHNPVHNDWHMGSIVPDGAGLRWTNKAGASWHLTPDLPNQRLLAIGPDNPYAAQGLREFTLLISNGQITGFQFAGGTYLRDSAPPTQAPVHMQPQVMPRGLPQVLPMTDATAPAATAPNSLSWSAHADQAINCSASGCLSAGPGCDMQAVPGQCSFPKAQAQQLCAAHGECRAITCNATLPTCQARMETKLDSWPGVTSYVRSGSQAEEPVHMQPQVMPRGLPQITAAMVPGSYRHNPVHNDWHLGSIVPDGAGLRWTNKAGASWHLTPDLPNQRLLAIGPDNPYAAQRLRDSNQALLEFKLILNQHNGQITGFDFGGGTYLRETAQTQSQQLIRSRGVDSCKSSNWLGISLTAEFPLLRNPASAKSPMAVAGRAGLMAASHFLLEAPDDRDHAGLSQEAYAAIDQKELCSNQWGTWFFVGGGLGKIPEPGVSLNFFICPEIQLKDFEAWGASVTAFSKSAGESLQVNGIFPEIQFPLDFSSACLTIPIGFSWNGNPLNEDKHPKASNWIKREGDTGYNEGYGIAVDHAWPLKNSGY